MTIFQNINGTDPAQSPHLNYIFGVPLIIFSIIFSLTSTLLNPLVLLYYCPQKSLAASLFRLLAIVDFVSNLYFPLIIR